jgi:beta-lactamase regulating signal transducer with metallopeptidase domain
MLQANKIFFITDGTIRTDERFRQISKQKSRRVALMVITTRLIISVTTTGTLIAAQAIGLRHRTGHI